MNAVICFRSFPLTSFGGVRAITTSTPAFTPFVHQSFSPLRTNSEPSGVGSARKLIVAGSEPACDSVSAKAEISPPATRGKYFCFCALRRTGINPIEIVAPDEKIARKTAAVIQWIARGFGQLECFALAFRHLRRVDRTGCGLCRLGAGFGGNLFFGSLEGRLH